MRRLTGLAAIDYAAARGLVLSKYTDPTDEARDGLTVAEAREIARVDPSLIYLELHRVDRSLIFSPPDDDTTARFRVLFAQWRETDEARRMGESPLRSHETGDDDDTDGGAR